MKTYYVYIMANSSGSLYIGVTNDLERRVWEHKHKINPSFASTYNIDKLLYCEDFSDVRDAIAREKQMKRWSRQKKINLFEPDNPRWEDISAHWYDADDLHDCVE